MKQNTEVSTRLEELASCAALEKVMLAHIDDTQQVSLIAVVGGTLIGLFDAISETNSAMADRLRVADEIIDMVQEYRKDVLNQTDGNLVNGLLEESIKDLAKRKSAGERPPELHEMSILCIRLMDF